MGNRLLGGHEWHDPGHHHESNVAPSATKVTGMAMTKDMKGKAPEGFMLTIMTTTTPPTSTMALTLADGANCKDAGTSMVNIIDKESKSFKAEASGVLVCADKEISYKAKLNK